MRTKRVLIVEDNPAISEAYKLVLEQEGYDVVVAENGKDALLKLKNGTPLPDLILLDLMMPVMNGWEFLAAQSADPALAGVPVVALTCGIGPTPSGENVRLVTDKPMDIFELTNLVRRQWDDVIPGNEE